MGVIISAGFYMRKVDSNTLERSASTPLPPAHFHAMIFPLYRTVAPHHLNLDSSGGGRKVRTLPAYGGKTVAGNARPEQSARGEQKRPIPKG